MTVPLLPSARLRNMRVALPSLPAPVGRFVPAMRCGDLLFLSGQGPVEPDGRKHMGKVGDTVSLEEAREHARIVTLNLLAAVEAEVGSIDRIAQIVKVLGFVNAAPDFERHPAVIDGCSDLLLDVFGSRAGRHARSAIGAGSLPSGITVEIEMIVRVATRTMNRGGA